MANLPKNRIRERLATGLVIILLACAGKQARGQTNTTAVQPPSAPGSAAAPDASGDFQCTLLAELRILRAELLEYRIEIQAGKIAALQVTLEQTRARKLRLSDEEHTRVQQFPAQEPQFSGQILTPEQRSQLEFMRAALMSEQAERTRAEQADLAIRESAADAGLRATEQRLHDLQVALHQLTASR